MLTTQTPTASATPLVIGAATVIPLTIMGDLLMYSLLPLEAEALGIPIVYVGLLLETVGILVHAMIAVKLTYKY